MFLRTGAFFSSILSEFLKNLVALQKTWTTLKKYTKEELEMYEQDTPAYYGTFDFEDTVIGRDYRALVGVYAERNGGGDLRSVYTNEVTAKR